MACISIFETSFPYLQSYFKYLPKVLCIFTFISASYLGFVFVYNKTLFHFYIRFLISGYHLHKCPADQQVAPAKSEIHTCDVNLGLDFLLAPLR